MTNEYNPRFTVGQQVEVARRAWPGINKPGGVGNITQIHYSEGYAASVDVKYLIQGGIETCIDLDFVEPHEYLSRGRRSRTRNEVTNIAPPSPKRKKQRTNTTTKKKNTKTALPAETAPPPVVEENDPPPLCEADPAPSDENETTEEFPVPSAIDVRNDGGAEVSPLPNDRSVASFTLPRIMPSEPQPTQVALKKKKKNSATVITAVTQEESKKPSAKEPKAKKKAPPEKRVKSDIATKAPSAKKALEKSLDKKPSNDGAKEPRAKTTHASKPAKHPPADSKLPAKQKTGYLQPKKLLQNTQPPLKLAPRVSIGADVAEGTRVPFQEVYDNKMQSAKAFVTGLVGEKTTKKLVVKPTRTAEAVFTMEPVRREKFMEIFSELLREQDGELDTLKLLGDMNGMLARKNHDEPFTSVERDGMLKSLSDQDKIMLCGDKLYSI